MTRLHSIWLADDDIDDCEIFAQAITELLPDATLTIVPNGEELMQLITADYPPDLLFLDLNMPCKNGLDCLKEIRAQKQFSRLPVIIFSSSIQPQHVETSYRYGANLFYSKPSTFSELIAGLSNLVKMNWEDPYTVTSNHYVNSKYISYKAKAGTDGTYTV